MGTVLVAGGAGYIGSFAVKALVSAGHDVVVFDSLAQGHREAIDRLAAAMPGAAERLSLVVGDVRDRALVRDVLVSRKVDAVMHFAAWLLVGESVSRPVEYYENNVGGALAVLGAMADAGVGRFIFSSTAATFGEPERSPIDEDHPQRPINTYGETKLAIERALPHFERAYGLRSVVLRYFNAAGADPDGEVGEAHDPESHLMPLAIDALLGIGRPLTVYGTDYDTPDGTGVRDFVHVDDLADAHVRALDYLGAGGKSAALNLGSGHGYSVRQLIDTTARIAGTPVPHSVGTRRAGDAARLVCDTTLVQRELGWSPTYGLEAQIEHALRWRRKMPR
jgi:UDP-glucose-4-epimerase GalE